MDDVFLTVTGSNAMEENIWDKYGLYLLEI
jgi:hypothetical protein